MTVRRKIIAVTALCCLLLLLLTGCSRGPESTRVTKTYYAGSKSDKYSFNSVTMLHGHQYKLQDTKYKVIHENPPQKRTLHKVTAEDNQYLKGSTFTIDGEEFEVVDVKTKETPLTLDQEIGSKKPDPSYVGKYKADTGESVPVTYLYEKSSWDKADRFPIKIVGYGGPYYDLGTVKLSSKDTLKDVKKKEKKVLEAQGLNPKAYRISKVSWNGKTYKDVSGNTCRDIDVQTEKQTAHYSGMIYTYDVTYVSTLPNPNRYTIKATATYVPDSSEYTRSTAIVISVVGILAVVVLIILLRLRNKKQPSVKIGDKDFHENDFI